MSTGFKRGDTSPYAPKSAHELDTHRRTAQSADDGQASRVSDSDSFDQDMDRIAAATKNIRMPRAFNPIPPLESSPYRVSYPPALESSPYRVPFPPASRRTPRSAMRVVRKLGGLCLAVAIAAGAAFLLVGKFPWQSDDGINGPIMEVASRFLGLKPSSTILADATPSGPSSTAMLSAQPTAVDNAPANQPQATIDKGDRLSPRVDETPPVASEDAARAAPPVRRLDAEEIALLLKRGEDFISVGDLASARVVLQRAAEAGNARAALALAGTFDPQVLARLGVRGLRGDTAQARAWYEKARELGSTDATRRIDVLAGPAN
jgi:hypothetical protein